jgi:hypothetical protein
MPPAHLEQARAGSDLGETTLAHATASLSPSCDHLPRDPCESVTGSDTLREAESAGSKGPQGGGGGEGLSSDISVPKELSEADTPREAESTGSKGPLGGGGGEGLSRDSSVPKELSEAEREAFREVFNFFDKAW